MAECFTNGVVEVVIDGEFGGSERDLGGLGHIEETRGAHGMEAHALVVIGRLFLEEREGVRHAVTPVAEDARSGGAGIGIRRAEELCEQLGVHDVVPLVNPERLGEMVLIFGIILVEAGDPGLHAGDDFRGVVFAELDLGEVADLVFAALEQFEQRGDRLAVDLGLPREWAALGGDAVDAAVLVVAVCVAEMALEVADERVVPVHDVERAIGTGGGIDRAEIKILRLEDVGLARALDAGAVGLEVDAVDALKADAVRVEIVAPIFVGEMPARENRAAGAGTRGAVPDGFQLRMFRRVVQAAAEGRAPVGVVAGGVGDDVIAPIVEGAAVGVGEAEGDVGVEFSRERLVAIDGAVDIAHGPGDGFDLRAVENAVTK